MHSRTAPFDDRRHCKVVPKSIDARETSRRSTCVYRTGIGADLSVTGPRLQRQLHFWKVNFYQEARENIRANESVEIRRLRVAENRNWIVRKNHIAGADFRSQI